MSTHDNGAPGTAGIRAAHGHALALAGAAVAAVRPADLARPTPCGDWTLADLLGHVIGRNHAMAAAALGAGPDLALWADLPCGDDPAATLAESVLALEAALDGAAADGRPFWLPEIRTDRPFPAEVALSFHFLDTLVHAWDVSVSLGRPQPCPPEPAALLLTVASRVPPGPDFRGPGRQFGEQLGAPDGAGPFERALALLGRDPHWAPAR
ncbi:TIGR03086 family metal-binding protein [Kitasatospora sp. NPDC057223]|uniref:TIGR03086 family metal-binding protein n=1 Tax=Kitasatospora sp. NPDC057223 TaxID=3346055 RepID=UPI003644AD71